MSDRDAQATAEGADDGGRDETETERRDRQYEELLQELRVMQTGVQVLFAFLLGVPFTQRFSILDGPQRLLYFAVLLAAGGAVLFLLAPGAWHRALFGLPDKTHLVVVSHRLAIAGITFVGLAVCGVIVLIATILYPGNTAAVVGSACVLAFLLTWLVLPLRGRGRAAAVAHGESRRPGTRDTTGTDAGSAP